MSILTLSLVFGGIYITSSPKKASAKTLTKDNTPTILQDTVSKQGNNSVASSTSISPNLVVSPNYIPAPSGTIEVIMMTNYTLGQQIQYLSTLSTVSAITQGVLDWFVSTANPYLGTTLTAVSFTDGSLINRQLDLYKQAYYAGENLYGIVKSNPNYYGQSYVNPYIIDWTPSSTPILKH